MVQTVVVLGGVVAELSAANELIERGFEVEVYEALSIPGGRRNVALGGSGNPGPIGMRKNPPDEHGLRFFARIHRSFGRSALPGRPRLRRPSLTPCGRRSVESPSALGAQSHRHPEAQDGNFVRTSFWHSGSVREAHDG